MGRPLSSVLETELPTRMTALLPSWDELSNEEDQGQTNLKNNYTLVKCYEISRVV